MMNTSALAYHCFCPPPLYIQDIAATTMTYSKTITHVAHVVDICSTACSCLSFIIGRLYSINAIEKISPILFILLFVAIYCASYFGLEGHDRGTAIPFLGELLYPGILTGTALLAPLLKWPASKNRALFGAFCAVTLAFAMGLSEVYLCRFLGPHFTAPMWAFLLCDVTFVFVADLIEIAG